VTITPAQLPAIDVKSLHAGQNEPYKTAQCRSCPSGHPPRAAAEAHVSLFAAPPRKVSAAKMFRNSATHKNEQGSIKHLIFVSSLRPPRSSGVTVASVTIPIQKRDRPLNRSPLILREHRARETDQPNANSISDGSRSRRPWRQHQRDGLGHE
jgi:hypothetical protein